MLVLSFEIISLDSPLKVLGTHLFSKNYNMGVGCSM